MQHDMESDGTPGETDAGCVMSRGVRYRRQTLTSRGVR